MSWADIARPRSAIGGAVQAPELLLFGDRDHFPWLLELLTVRQRIDLQPV
jgi:hypothetical protein